MKYKLQVEKLKQIQMEKDLIKELEEENAKLVSENEDLATDLFNTQARERSRKIDIEFLKDRINVLNEEIDLLSKENTKLIEILNIRNKESEQQDVLFTMLFEFAEWAALNYVRLNGVWCHRYAPQTNKDCWITTDKLFEIYKYKNDYSSQAGRV